MYVYKKDANVAVGDLIQVDGVVEEYVGPGYAERFETDLTTTEIKASRVAVIAKDQSLPAPIVLGENGVKIPTRLLIMMHSVYLIQMKMQSTFMKV